MKELDRRELMKYVSDCMVASQKAGGDVEKVEHAHDQVMNYIQDNSWPGQDKFIHTKCPGCRGYVNPLVAVDIILTMDMGIVLIERKNPPYGWALPGGYVDIGETFRQAAKRELREETGLGVDGLGFFRMYDQPDRDPRFHTISTVFVGSANGEMKAGDDAVNVKVFQSIGLPELAFDHNLILDDYFGVRRKK